MNNQNRGIGHAICQTLAAEFQDSLVLYATSRKGENLGFKPSSSETQVKYPKLDIGNSSSVNDLAKTIKGEHGGLDVLINNAGVNLDDQYSPENVKTTLNTNYRGTLNVSIIQTNASWGALADKSMGYRCAKLSCLF